ncbi:hypothetical protein ALP97_200007 [Pseudomonas salomonii]|uniref:Uncharacterized protein n=1 Tax=Pseudomonas salomonii TaxID=191391 RepID=A0A3M4PUW7_9PSED|nr:hypothetical protein ALP97_200007 [Pseudomonas salomonii]
MGSGEVDDHRARFHLCDGFGTEQGRGFAARDQRRGDDDVRLFGAFMHGQGLTLHPARRHRACVTANTDRAFTLFIGFVGHVDELGAEGLDLLFYGRAHVRRFDHGAQAFRRGDGLQAGDTRAEDQHARGFDGAGGSHQHRHEAWVVMGCQQHRFIAGNVGL